MVYYHLVVDPVRMKEAARLSFAQLPGKTEVIGFVLSLPPSTVGSPSLRRSGKRRQMHGRLPGDQDRVWIGIPKVFRITSQLGTPRVKYPSCAGPSLTFRNSTAKCCR